MLLKGYLLTWERGMDGAIVVGAEIGIPHGSTRGGWGPNPMLGSISNKSAKLLDDGAVCLENNSNR